jgi:hypothetical protein
VEHLGEQEQERYVETEGQAVMMWTNAKEKNVLNVTAMMMMMMMMVMMMMMMMTVTMMMMMMMMTVTMMH